MTSLVMWAICYGVPVVMILVGLVWVVVGGWVMGVAR
jgi:hypothetical protein